MSRSMRAAGAVRALSAVLLAVTAPPRDPPAVVRLQVVPDRADWTYTLGAPASFRVFATRDGHPLALPAVTWKLGPEMLEPAREKNVALPRGGAGGEGA